MSATPEIQEHLQWLRSAVSYANDERCRLALHGIEQEIERLQAESAEMKKHLDLALPQAARSCLIEKELEQAKAWRKCQTHGDINGATQWGCPDCVVQLRGELEQAKSQQVHCLACGGVECHRLAEIVKLTGMESDQHLVEWVEQAKERERRLREALTLVMWHDVYDPDRTRESMMKEMIAIAEAALTVPTAQRITNRPAEMSAAALESGAEFEIIDTVPPAKEKP